MGLSVSFFPAAGGGFNKCQKQETVTWPGWLTKTLEAVGEVTVPSRYRGGQCQGHCSKSSGRACTLTGKIKPFTKSALT